MKRVGKVCRHCPEFYLAFERSKDQHRFFGCLMDVEISWACAPLKELCLVPVPRNCPRCLEHTVLGKNNQQDDDRGK